MSFQAVLPISGYAGWKFLERTKDAQEQSLGQSPTMKRELEYFREKIGSVKSAEELVADHTLLKVALGAFGLGDDLPNKAFIKKVLSEGSIDDSAFANRLSDKRYLEFTRVFGFDLPIPGTQNENTVQDLISAYQDQAFEISIGEQDDDMRLGLTVERKLTEIANGAQSENAKWFLVMGNPPLREVFETAFNLPQSFGSLDLDRQLAVFKEKAGDVFKTTEISQFVEKDVRDALIKRFMINAQVQRANEAYNPQSAALTILQSASSGGVRTY